MKISIKTRADPQTDQIYLRKLSDYGMQQGINITMVRDGNYLWLEFDAPEPQLKDIKEHIEKMHKEMTDDN